jgi:inorganic pyrophosphatase
MDPFYRHIRGLEDIPASLRRELTYFFNNYKRAEGNETQVEAWEGAERARELIQWAMRNYDEQHP